MDVALPEKKKKLVKRMFSLVFLIPFSNLQIQAWLKFWYVFFQIFIQYMCMKTWENFFYICCSVIAC